jgi:hypothetical protein
MPTLQSVGQSILMSALNATFVYTTPGGNPVADYPSVAPVSPTYTGGSGPVLPGTIIVLGSPATVALWSATVSFQTKLGGAAFAAATAFPVLGGQVYSASGVTSATAPGQWLLPTLGVFQAQLLMSVYASGQIQAAFYVTTFVKLAGGQYLALNGMME